MSIPRSLLNDIPRREEPRRRENDENCARVMDSRFHPSKRIMAFTAKWNVEECRPRVRSISSFCSQLHAASRGPIGSRDTDELKIAARYIGTATRNTLNETRFIIDLDETAAPPLASQLAARRSASVRVRVRRVRACTRADNGIAGLRFVP